MKSNYHMLIKGIEEFNKQEFFAAHETLEDFWRTLSGDERELVQSIIQAAVAYYHFGRGNQAGAQKLLTRAVARAESVSEGIFGIDTGPYLEAIKQSLKSVESEGQAGSMPMPTIQFKPN